MWYKHFSKQSWNLRVWRKQNLYYNQDDIGMFKNKAVLRWKDFIFRVARNEGVLRGFNFFFGYAVIGSLIYLKTVHYDPVYVLPKQIEGAKKLEENDAEAKRKLFYNRYGAPTRPHKDLDSMITFLAGSKTYDELADYLSFDAAMNVSMDQQNGLDSWMSKTDRQALKYYQQSQGKKVSFDE